MAGTVDRFGNPYAPGLPYAGGAILGSTEDHLSKLQRAWDYVRERVERAGADTVFNFTGLERSLAPESLQDALLDDELAGAVYGGSLRTLGLDHLGGQPDQQDVFLTNRLTAAIHCAMQVMVRPGSSVIGVSARYSHPAVVRAVGYAAGRFHDTRGLTEFTRALQAADDVSVVVLTRLSVSYELLDEHDLHEIIERARARGAAVFADDAGGARVGPALFDQPRTLELGIDAGATGLDKYGTIGPRLGLLGGRADLVGQIRARAFELGMEARPMLYAAVVHSLQQYRPQRVRDLVACTKTLGHELRRTLGDLVRETPVIVRLDGEDILAEAMRRAGIDVAPIVPVEATAALAMLLLRDHGILTVHFAGLPPGTSALLIKFVPPEVLDRFGGASQFTRVVDSCLSTMADLLREPDAIRALLVGAPALAGVR